MVQKLTRKERNKVFFKPKKLTMWDMLDEKSKENLKEAKAKALITK